MGAKRLHELPKKIGILGGTFNPVHLGHIHLAQKAMDVAGLDQVLFVPSGVSYMKDQREILPAKHRIEMVRLAVADNSHFDISTIETDKKGNSYSHETIRELQRRQPEAEFYFLTGADTLFSIESWKDPASIFHSVTILAAYRTGRSLEELERQIVRLHDIYQADIRLIAVDHLDISSSYIRNAIQSGKSTDGLMPSAVENYIAQHHFYRSTDEDQNDR